MIPDQLIFRYRLNATTTVVVEAQVAYRTKGLVVDAGDDLPVVILPLALVTGFAAWPVDAVTGIATGPPADGPTPVEAIRRCLS